ncbi:hypothetical protein L7F22_012009 [Adiantum nelumboides]|nr:hypothetical protein [Adiantum nelumboides]
MAHMYREVRCKIKTQEGYSQEFMSNMGVKQGCPLSPTLFGLCIDQLEEVITQCMKEEVDMYPSLQRVCFLQDSWMTLVTLQLLEWFLDDPQEQPCHYEGRKNGSMYSMFVSSVNEHSIYVVELPSTELRHSRLGHSQKGMKTLQRFGYLPV